MKTPLVTIWNEYRHEKLQPEVSAVYPKGIHSVLLDALSPLSNMRFQTAHLDDPDHGLTDAVLAETDVLIWWAHCYHREVRDDIVAKARMRVLEGMSLIVLHSGHFSKLFKSLMGTTCSLCYREANDKERLWNVMPSHPAMEGIGPYIELPIEEMYGEPFDVPTPDELLMISWFTGGEVFRSCCTWKRGNGKVFYFRPGHESYPTYYDPNVQRILRNAVNWALPGPKPSVQPTERARHVKDPIEPLPPRTPAKTA